MNQRISVSINSDENGFIGRECPKCKEYFKIKFGTGLPIHQYTCPYCNYTGDNDEFFTEAQIEYGKSVAIKKVVGPILDSFHRSFKKLETSTKGGFIQIKVRTSGNVFKIKYYQEKILETNVICDSCGLNFSIYGVFSNCPDCGRLNAKFIFEKSMEVLKNKLKLSEDSTLESSLKNDLLKDSLIGAISSFDSFGKSLRDKHNTKFLYDTKNLFQNFLKLNESLKIYFGKNIKDYLSQQDSDFLFKMFQVRHIYEHTAGVIDNDFIKKLPQFNLQKGRKYILDKKEILLFLEKLLSLAQKIYLEVE
ncbi:MAG: hypothetical protein PHN56_03945 [Candidatus Nanoarchaeia archaeon]|nr:hypothetical protein [Candidatus Nanoarchaeia archaeon]